MLLVIYFVVIFNIVGADINIISSNENDNIIPIIKHLLNHSEFNNSYKPTIVILDGNEKEHTNSLEYNISIRTIVNVIVKNYFPITIIKNVTSSTNYGDLDKGTVFILLFYQNCEDLLKEVEIVRKFKYIIIVDALLDENCKATAEKILNIFSLYDIIIAVTNRDREKFFFLTVIPHIDENNCRLAKNINITIINNHNDVIVNNKNILFPLKTPLDLMKCVFNVGMATLYPYAMIQDKDKLKNLDPLKDVHGSDVELMKIIANYYNATIQLYYIYREEENPYLHLEFIDLLLNGTLDACAGGLYRIYGDVVSYSGIYTRQSVIWVFTAGEKVRSWQSLIGKMHYLYMFFIYYICYVIIWSVICKFDRRNVSLNDTLLYSWGALFGTSSLQQATTLKQKILNIVYLVMCLYLSAYIGSQIYSYLTIQEPPQHFKTMEELIVSDRTPYLRFATKFFVQDKKYEVFANSSRDCDGFYDCQEKIMKYKGSTILISGHLPPLQASTAVNDEARVLRVSEDIIIVYHEMIIRKNHPVANNFEKVVQRLFESGICQKLYIEAIGITVVDKARIVNKNSLSNSYSCTVGCKITLIQSAGAFYFWIFGCVLSFCIFILEILSSK